MAMPTNATPRVLVDWYDAGAYTGAVDDVTSAVLGTPGVTIEYGRDTARSTSPPMIGAGEFTLNNENRAYSPENASSPLYQFMRPGRAVRIETTHGERSLYRSHKLYRSHTPYRGLGVYPLMTGRTEAFAQHPEWGHRAVDVSALGTATQLRRKIVSVDFFATLRTDSAAGFVLTAAGWPVDKQVLHVSDSIMNGFWVDQRPAWDVLVELLATEGAGAVMYEAPDGTFYWKNRNHRATEARSTTSQATLQDGTGTGLYYQHLSYEPRWEDVINRVTITTKQRALAGAPTVVWKLGTPLTVASPNAVTIWARGQDPFRNAITPVDTVDYTVAGGTVFLALSQTGGGGVEIVVQAISGVPVISNLQLRAYSYPVVGETQIEASTTVPDAEEKTLTISAWPEIDPAQAQAIADSYLERYSDSRPIITLTFQNADGPHMEKILDLEISDRITIINQHLGLNADAYVERIRHEITGAGRHAITLACEPVFSLGSVGFAWDAAGSLWDTATWGI